MKVPDSLDEVLSPEWMTGALSQKFPGIEVTKVTQGELIQRVATNQRFVIECAGGVPDGLPIHLCLKGYWGDYGEQYRYVSATETFFYRDIASTTGIRTLRSVATVFDQEKRHGVVITEDVAEQGAVFLDSLSPYSVEQVAESLRELAKLHAATWCSPVYKDLAWLAPHIDQYLLRRGIPEISANFDGPIGAGVPEDVRHAQLLVDSFAALARFTATDSPWCLMHGDCHVGNVFLDPLGRPSFTDWQMIQRGPWYLDVGYHIGSTLDPADRRANEDDLLRVYLDELSAQGVERPLFDEARERLSLGFIEGFFLWGITQKVDPPITTRLLTRLGTAVSDHDAFAVMASL
jgi:hypothetical protein